MIQAADEIERLQKELQGVRLGADGMGWAPNSANETLGKYPEYTNEIGDAGQRYMQQRCGGHISSGFFYWHELWDALNAAAYSSKETTALPTAYRPECEGGTGGKCTQPDCEVCWPDEPVKATMPLVAHSKSQQRRFEAQGRESVLSENGLEK